MINLLYAYPHAIPYTILGCLLFIIIFMLYAKLTSHTRKQINLFFEQQTDQIGGVKDQLIKNETLTQFLSELLQGQKEAQVQQSQQHFDNLKAQQNAMTQGLALIQQHVAESLKQHGERLGQQMSTLSAETKHRLGDIATQVDERLAKGFEKTTSTFADVMQRLTIIDQAQKRITELSTNVADLQEILTDKRSRGAFGEVQLKSLIGNMIPASHYKMQHTFKNGKRVDCALFLPDPTGTIAIDAKFPLENYRTLINAKLPASERKQAESLFKQDIKKHIQDIADKYIISNETSDGAVMFIPAEAVFAEIHSNFPVLIEYAHKRRVWLASPTTMMAILTTARAVLRDAATRKQVHIIQEHLSKLGDDFKRFQDRMNKLAKHIGQSHKDVQDIHTSSEKISQRFTQIESVELDELITE